ncbi:hypothetical protein BJ684DRAFT_8857 [Piptocephalis cylindrospora]|uniref:Hsp90 chaperone protein kinase-targeting subunit n=1 Tax=Piptocephalis cylindrospora TaxID=1907219 RepID=A0A4P9Y5G3_9FUNG|nr:hypothetical protein BJ684DRAFT_8857 [Piptocephalis cylindrospora]|eukprot:RKP14258.1 hypothetical protein BJ684DRAFT_8857 [Piptocephalis cylindrospora]
MVLDYSRFDNLELSDDEDIEVHPNIDKASWVRFKQQEIHAERAKRRERIEEIAADLQLSEVLQPRLLGLTKGKDWASNAKMTSENMFKEKSSRTIINKPSSEDKDQDTEEDWGAEENKDRGPSSGSGPATTTTKQTSPISVQFSHLTQLEESWKMLKKYPELFKDETPWEEVMALAFEASTEKNYPRMENCIRQGKILEYVRELGPSRLDLFFQRMLGTGDMARRTYFDDVARTIAHVRKRGAVLREEKVAQDAKRAQLAEEDQDAPLEMQVPEDATEEDIRRAEAFDTFPPRFQRALLSGDLEKVNEALSHIPPEEQQTILDLCGSVGFLDIEGTVDEEDKEKGTEPSNDLAETLD